MKKVLAITIAVVMCISIFTFNAYPSNAIAQVDINENNISVINANVEPTIQSVNLEGINATDIKQNDVTEYYKNQDSIARLLSAAAPTAAGTTWAKTYGGSDDDYARSIQQTSDGGYIVAGYTSPYSAGPEDASNVGQIASFGTTSINSTVAESSSNDFLVIKLTASGTLSWAKTYGGSYDDFARSIQQTSDGGYIVAGRTYSFGVSNDDCLVIKLKSNGDVSWAKTYGGSGYDYARSIQQTSDGYIVAGDTYSFGVSGENFLVIKLDSTGDVSWANAYGGIGHDYARSIQQTSDGGYIVAGRTFFFGVSNDDCLVIKLKSNGDVSWAKTYGGSGHDWAYSIQQTSDGYIVAGDTHGSFTGSQGANDFLVIKLDLDGNVSWAKTYGGNDDFDSDDSARSIQQTSDGGYIVAGDTYPFSVDNSDFLVIKLHSDGTVDWAKTYGGSDDDYARSIQQTSDGGYIVAGYTVPYSAEPKDASNVGRIASFGTTSINSTVAESSSDDFLVIKLDSNGEIGGSCDYLQDCTLTVNKQSITGEEQTPTTTEIVANFTKIIGSFSETPADVDTGEPDIQSNTICKGSVAITAIAGSGGSISPSGTVTVNYGADQTFTITPDAGYHIKDVLVDGTSVGAVSTYTFTNVITNHTISVTFEIDTFTITASVSGGHGSILPSGIIGVNYGGNKTFTITPDAGYHIKDVLVDGTSVGAVSTYTFTNVITNHTISATFEIDTFTITASVSGGHGSISPSGDVTVNYGDSKTFTIKPNVGYMINRILVDGSPIHFTHTSGETYTFTNVTSDHTISATFIRRPTPTFTVTASVSVYGGYATVTPKEQTVQQGSPAKITINPDAGYHITGLIDNDNTIPMTKLVENANGTYTYTILAVYENHQIIVTLEKNKYTITAKAGEGGTISPSGNVTVKYNETQSFTITPDSGYRIDKIVVDGKPITSTEQIYKFKNVKNSHTIEVTFVRASVKTPLIITLQINNPEITINGISKTIDAQGSKPIIKNDRTLIPIRALIESLGGQITWNGETREVTINLDYHTIILTIDSNTAVVGGIKMQIDPNNGKVTPVIINGRTYLPLRFIAEHLNANVDWDNETRTVTIYYWP